MHTQKHLNSRDKFMDMRERRKGGRNRVSELELVRQREIDRERERERERDGKRKRQRIREVFEYFII